MDSLSQVVGVMRTGRPVSFRLQAGGTWGWRYPPVRGAAFHVVLQGSCWLLPADGEPVALAAGDVVLFPHGTGHGLADRPETPLPALCRNETQTHAVVAGTAAGGAEPELVAVCGQYLVDRERPHPMFAELPDVVHLPNRLGRYPALHTAVELLGREVDAPEPGSDAIVPALLDVLFHYILRAWLTREDCTRPESRGWGAALSDEVVGAALAAIHTEPERPWTVESLGAAAGLSRAAFARRVGYGSEFAFAAAFKREYGRPPGRFRTERTAA